MYIKDIFIISIQLIVHLSVLSYKINFFIDDLQLGENFLISYEYKQFPSKSASKSITCKYFSIIPCVR